MKPTKQSTSTTTIIIVSTVKHPQPQKQPKINSAILKAISILVITFVSWLNPEATIAITFVKLLFIVLQWLNKTQNRSDAK